MDHIRYAEGETPKDGWGGFEAYMKKKAAKLMNQFQSEASSCGKEDTSSIFKGISIFVNGYTDPPAERLKRLMMLHGGRFIYYPTKANTTHIIASNLAYTKIKELKNEKVVTPNWITDSVKAGKLLPHAPYLLYRPKASNQTLHRFTAKKSPEKTQAQHEVKGAVASPLTKPVSACRQSGTESDTTSTTGSDEFTTLHPMGKGDYIPTASKKDKNIEINFSETCKSKNSNMSLPVIDASAKTGKKTVRFACLPQDKLTQESTNNKQKITSHNQNVSSVANVEKETDSVSSYVCGKTDSLNECPKTVRTPSAKETAFIAVNKKIPQQKTEECSDSSYSWQVSSQNGKLYYPKSTDPNFLNSFYRHSSFYHLTSWRAEHRLFVKELHRNSDGTFHGKEKLIAMFGKNKKSVKTEVNETSRKAETAFDELVKQDQNGATKDPEWGTEDEDRVIMHIDIDAFFVTVSLLNYPELRGKPVAVAHYAGKPTSKSSKYWKEKTLSEKHRGYKNHCQEFWAGEDNMLKVPKDVKQGSNTGKEGGEQALSKAGAESEVPSLSCSQALVASESENFSSLAAIASCNYEARQAGVRNGMVMKTAKELCPELRTIPYNFEGYYTVSRRLYEIIASYTHDIQAASCDEVMLDIRNLMEETGATGSEIAEVMREEIFKKTQCTASAGIAPTVILAKLCTKAAKPDGVFYLEKEGISEFLKTAPVGNLPGIGRVFNKKLQSMGIYTCSDLQNMTLKTVQKHFGPRTGQILYENCRGRDTRTLEYERERKYVSVEVNYGIRFDSDDDAYQFVHRLSEEVHRKLKRLVMQGRTVTLKLKVRRAGTPIEDPKFMGYGIYDSKIRSISLNMETDNLETIYRACRSLLLQMAVAAKDIRGVGIQMSRLQKPSSSTGKSKPLTEILPKKEDCPKQPKVPTSPTISSQTARKSYPLLSFVTKNTRAGSSMKTLSNVSKPSSACALTSPSHTSKANDGRKKQYASLEGIVLDQKCLVKRHHQLGKGIMSRGSGNESKRGMELFAPDLPEDMKLNHGKDNSEKKESAWKQNGVVGEVREKLLNLRASQEKRKVGDQVNVKASRIPVCREKEPSGTNTGRAKGIIMHEKSTASRGNASVVSFNPTCDRIAGDHSNRLPIGTSNIIVKDLLNRVGWDSGMRSNGELTGNTNEIVKGDPKSAKSGTKTSLQHGKRKNVPGDVSKEVVTGNTKKRLSINTTEMPIGYVKTTSTVSAMKTPIDSTKHRLFGKAKKVSIDNINRGLTGESKERLTDKTKTVSRSNIRKAPVGNTKKAPMDTNVGLMDSTKTGSVNVKERSAGSIKKASLNNTKKRLLGNIKKGLVGNPSKDYLGSSKRMSLDTTKKGTVGITKNKQLDIYKSSSRNVARATSRIRSAIDNSTKVTGTDATRTVKGNTHGAGRVDKANRISAMAGNKTSNIGKCYTVAEATKAKLWTFRRQENTNARQNLIITSVDESGEEVTAPLSQQRKSSLETHTNSDKQGKVGHAIDREGSARTKPAGKKEVGSRATPRTDLSSCNDSSNVSRKERKKSDSSFSSHQEGTHSESKIDPSVLQCLPQDIQTEVIRDYELDSKNPSDFSKGRGSKWSDPNLASTSTGITSELDQDVLQNLPPDILQEVVASERSRLNLPQNAACPAPQNTEKQAQKKTCKRSIQETLNMKLSSFKIPKLNKSSFKTRMATSTDTRGARREGNEVSTKQTCRDESGKKIHREHKLRDQGRDEHETPNSVTIKGGVKVKFENKSKISLGGACKFEDVKDKLKLWMELFEIPLDEDVSHVVHFMRSHILDQNLEMVFQLLRAFKRIVSASDKGSWRDAYSTIKDRVQTTVEHIYGGTLKLDEDL